MGPSQEQKYLTFETPNVEKTSNERFVVKNFPINTTTCIHGLIGFFDTVLYKDITFTIVPKEHAKICKEMLSWFPIIFPFKRAFAVLRGNQMRVSLWRKVTSKAVWYEWMAEVIQKETGFVTYTTSIHN